MDETPSPESAAEVALPFVVTGWNATDAVVTAWCSPIALGFVWLTFGAVIHDMLTRQHRAFSPTAAVLLLALLTVALFVVLVSAPLRYRLQIGPEGIDYAGLSLLNLTWSRAHFHLDADLDDHWPFECDEPEGITLRPSWLWRDGGESEIECFGPRGLEPTRAWLAKARLALGAARRATCMFTPELRCAILESQLGAIVLDRAERNSFGRIIAAETNAPIRFGGIELATGTNLFFNQNEYIDSSRPDRLTKAICGGPSKLSHGLFAQRGTRLAFHHLGILERIDGGAPGLLELDGFALDAGAQMELDISGRLMFGVLAKPLCVRSITLPVGSSVQARGFRDFDLSLTVGELKHPRKGGWRVTLAGPLALPDLALLAGDHLLIDRKLKKLIGVVSRREIEVAGIRTSPRFLPLPLKADGALDRGRRLAFFRKIDQRH